MRLTIVLASLPLALALATGCGSTDTPADGGNVAAQGADSEHHDEHHGPESLAEAVAELTEVRDEVRKAMQAGRPDDAHHPLHEVGKLLQAIPEVAADSDLPEEGWQAVKAETERLFDAFGEIDKAFHTKDGDKVAAYERVASTIDAAIAAIEKLLPQAAEKQGPPDADADN